LNELGLIVIEYSGARFPLFAIFCFKI